MTETGDQRIECPQCGKQYRWKPQLAGKKVRCKCSAVITVPTEEQTYDLDLGNSDSGEAAAAQGKTGAQQPCPSCGVQVPAIAVICVSCGFNLATGGQMETQVGRAVKQSEKRSKVYAGSHDGFFGRLGRSWQFAKISYGILWDFKYLVIFPVLSSIAATLVLASFILPAWGMGTMDQFMGLLDDDKRVEQVSPLVYVLVFLFYFCSYFVIAFFNTSLTACALKVCAGESPSIGYGLGIAAKRLPQIAGWSLVSATVGLILKIIENSNKKVGAIVAAILGTGWTVLTYFVIPVLAVEGVGPMKAVKQSVTTLRSSWGEMVLGNFSMRVLSILVMLPLYLALGALIFLMMSMGQAAMAVIMVVIFVIVVILSAAAMSAADTVFCALLYNYATGQIIPEEVDESLFAAAFAAKGG